MKKRLFQATSTALFFVLLIGFGIGQESTYLSQKLMLERDLHSRIENALSKILDDQRYVLDVTVDLTFTPTVKEEVTFRPGTEHTTTGIEPKAGLPSEGVSSADERKSRLTGLPIPGLAVMMKMNPLLQSQQTNPLQPLRHQLQESLRLLLKHIQILSLHSPKLSEWRSVVFYQRVLLQS